MLNNLIFFFLQVVSSSSFDEQPVKGSTSSSTSSFDDTPLPTAKVSRSLNANFGEIAVKAKSSSIAFNYQENSAPVHQTNNVSNVSNGSNASNVNNSREIGELKASLTKLTKEKQGVYIITTNKDILILIYDGE